MKQGDLRQLLEPRAWGECYLCRKFFSLADLNPVDSPSEDDWRFVCRACATVAKRPRKRGAK